MHPDNLALIENLYVQFRKDPASVDPTWRSFFEGMEFGSEGLLFKQKGEGRIATLIDRYRRYGHLKAKFNPLDDQNAEPEELSLKTLGFEEQEKSALFAAEGLLKEENASLEKILDVLENTYCGQVGIEYMGRHSQALEKWIQEKIEPTRFKPDFSPEQKKEILHQLNRAELFEVFLHTKYVGQKRFSLEGAETLIPILTNALDTAAELGMEECVIGMAHRGRLNVLTNILKKSYSQVFGEFEDYLDPNLMEGAGDVKYHKGFSADIETSSGRKIHIGLNANPSHLESVDPIVEGKVRAKQLYSQDQNHKKIIPILIHGDAAFSGQGVVYELLQLYNLKGYGNGGTVHIIVNNQIGFTTLPFEYRSTRYATDIASGFGFPVFHVNAEDPEKCVFAANLAMQIRQEFHIDVIIDLHCYRKYGHNESDEPSFTQPNLYKLIRDKKSIREIYRDSLIHEGVVEKEIALSLEEEFKKELHYELDELKVKKENISDEAFKGVWSSYKSPTMQDLFSPCTTSVDRQLLKTLGEVFCTIPEEIEIHPKLSRLLEQRKKMATGEMPVDWAMGEQLAFATLLWEGTHVRLSGQDSQRGTFTQRHAVCVDQNTGRRYFPLSHLKEGQGIFSVYNSLLSEFAEVGFEFGYSLAYPSALVLWEAQFGDFANGGQIIFDQYLSASRHKWQRCSGLTLLLPHGYEGQGAEHSSARLERFLQLSAEGNMQIVYPTTPAQYFHVLRRQVKRPFRLPLIIFTPKGLLRHPDCVSDLTAFERDSFQEILDDPNKPQDAETIIFCSGRIYYDLLSEQKKREPHKTAIIRLEQLYPLNQEQLKQMVGQYPHVKEYVWVQEEPRNMGSATYLYPILTDMFKNKIRFVCRQESATTATGSHKKHIKEQMELLEKAFSKVEGGK